MNKLIAIAVVSVFANLVGIAHAQAETTLAEVRAVSLDIKSVQLTDTGTLKIIGRNNSETVVALSKANNSRLVGAAQELANVEVVTVRTTIVCMMMVNPFTAQDLYIGNGSVESLKLLLSSSTCATANHTSPKEEFMTKIAAQLKNQMIVLAEQLAQ